MEEITEKKQKSVVVLVEGKYGIILLDDRNWVVARLKPLIKSDSCTPENFDNNSYTYHANLQQAVINLSNRLLKDTVPEESDKVKELKKKMQKFEEKLKECSTQQLIVMQAEIINELANRYNKEGGINPNNEELEEKKIERARDAPCKDNGLTYKERVDRYHGFPP